MKPYLKYGLIAAVTGILISMITFLLGLDKSDTGEYIGYLNIVIMVTVMVMAVKEKREQELGGYIEFGQAFRTGALTVIVAAAVTSVYTYFYMSVINPTMHDYIIQKQMEKMQEKGSSQEEIDMAMPYVEKFTTPLWASLWTLFMGIFFGIIIALIIAAIMKKANPNPFSNTSPSAN